MRSAPPITCASLPPAAALARSIAPARLPAKTKPSTEIVIPASTLPIGSLLSQSGRRQRRDVIRQTAGTGRNHRPGGLTASWTESAATFTRGALTPRPGGHGHGQQMIPRARLPQDLTLGHRRLGLTTYADPPFGAASASSLMIGSCRSDEPVLYVRPAGHPLPICPWASAPLRLLPVHVPQGKPAVLL